MTIERRDLLKASAIAASAVAISSADASAAAAKIVAEEHWVMKGPVKLHVYRKHQVGGAGKNAAQAPRTLSRRSGAAGVSAFR